MFSVIFSYLRGGGSEANFVIFPYFSELVLRDPAFVALRFELAFIRLTFVTRGTAE